MSGIRSNLKAGEIERAQELRKAYVDTLRSWATQKRPAVLLYWTLIGPVLRNAALRPTAVRLMCWLILSANKEGEVPRTYAQMADAVGVKERAIYEALAQLEKLGLIERLRFKPKGPAHVHIRVNTLVEAAQELPSDSV